MSEADTSRQGVLDGLRILIVEDDPMLAEATKGLLEDIGCKVVGPVGRLAEGLARAHVEPLDGAILDIDLRGELSFAIAEVLSGRGVPFLFMTGNQHRETIPLPLRSAPRLDKPVPGHHLLQTAAATFGSPAGVGADPQGAVLRSRRHAAGERSVCAGEGAPGGPGIRR